MAVITFDIDKQKVYVVVEETDIINTRDQGQATTVSAARYNVGKVFIDENLDICIIRGER